MIASFVSGLAWPSNFDHRRASEFAAPDDQGRFQQAAGLQILDQRRTRLIDIAADLIEVTGGDTGRISLAAGFGSHGQPVRRTRNKAGTVTDIWLAGGNLKPEKALAAEMERKYAPRKRRSPNHARP